ncbi:CBS domain-containing protein [Deinococcus roseus]|uniref:CBS domain-containing protein n=1 Tax=Deinococcus roseus TaxID=392414 RepID=A0ABQ2D645_9DEIO|nr:CBS domain-containing protein [Deinococcus roseus]GGJ42589.1 hypothetical protein GCM10008938_30920 [Deinococcus roseus]
MLVQERMTRNPLTVAPSTPALEAAARLKISRLHVLPVVAHGKLVGVVKERDLEDAAHRQAELQQQQLEQVGQHDSLPYLFTRLLLQNLTVQDVMAESTAELVPTMTLAQAARTLLTHHVLGLPVVQNGDLVGVLTVSDLLGALAETDPQVQA